MNLCHDTCNGLNKYARCDFVDMLVPDLRSLLCCINSYLPEPIITYQHIKNKIQIISFKILALIKNNSRIRTAFCITACFIIALVFIRARVLGYSYSFLFQQLKHTKKILFLSYLDVIYAAGLGIFFICLLYFARPYKKLSSVVFWLFVTCIIVSLLWALVNVQALDVLNTPINYQLLYYADLFESSYV